MAVLRPEVLAALSRELASCRTDGLVGMNELTGKKVLVTGGSRGIGLLSRLMLRMRLPWQTRYGGLPSSSADWMCS
jgi:hypothetical protein